MGFECFKCGKTFDEFRFILSHLKLNHFIKNNTVPMKCLVPGNFCTEEFYCFNRLKSHVKNCQPTNTEPKPNLEKSFENFNISDYVSKQTYLLFLKLSLNISFYFNHI